MASGFPQVVAAMLRPTAMTIAAAAFMGCSTAVADGPLLQTRSHGVTVSTYRIERGFLFCLAAREGTKIAAEYGIEFRIPAGEQPLWSDQLPKLVTRNQNYFDLPLAVEIKSSEAPQPRRISLHLGICVDARYCNPVDIPLTIPSSSTEPVRDKSCGG